MNADDDLLSFAIIGGIAYNLMQVRAAGKASRRGKDDFLIVDAGCTIVRCRRRSGY